MTGPKHQERSTKDVQLEDTGKEVVGSELCLPDETAGLEALRDQKADKEACWLSYSMLPEKLEESQKAEKEVCYLESTRSSDSTGLHIARDNEGDKEIFHWKRATEGSGWKYSRICGFRRAWFFFLLGLTMVVALAIALGIGLTRGIDQTSSTTGTESMDSNDEYLIGGSVDPAYYSTTGVFNGTGITLASETLGGHSEGIGNQFVYFQHYTGEIRWMFPKPDGTWFGGGVEEVVTAGAKNNTPLSTISYVFNRTAIWHVFYIDSNNYIREKVSGNSSYIWTDGAINEANLLANDQEEVGMQVCWYANNWAPSPGIMSEVGLALWYAKDNTTFEEWRWSYGDTNWTFRKEWPNLNGHTGVGCYTWGPGTTIYTMFVNTNNIVEIWWRDGNRTLANTTTHPIDVWTKTAIEIHDVHPATSLAYTNLLYAQLPSNQIVAHNITFAAENTTFQGPPATLGDEPFLPGTRIAATAIPGPGDQSLLVVFAQKIGNTISQLSRTFAGSEWTSKTLPVP